MAFSPKAVALLSLSSALLQVSAIALVGENICPIPYLIPRALQNESDTVDEYISDKDLPRTGPAQWLSSALISSTPSVWSREPHCLRSSFDIGDICVYTSEWFAKGRGISIVAQPTQAPLVARAKALTHQTIYEWPDYANPIEDDRVELEAIPNKDFGMRSKVIIERGDAAQSYTPVISVQDNVMQLKREAWEQNAVLQRAIDQLPPYANKVFLGLHGQFGGNPIYDKINTNAFNALLGKSDEFFWSIYPETSRYNHDCRPSTMYSIDSEDLMHNLRVGRRIIPGEELSLSYLAPNMRSAERKSRMKAQWGFECSCPLCTAPADVQILSDYRVTLIEDLEKDLNDLSINRNGSIATAELLISLHQQERLDGVIGDAYMYASFEHSYVGDKRGAQKYAALALEHMAIWRGISHQYYQAMQRVLIDPTTEKSWKYIEKLQAAQDANKSK